jgi:hypothetical protein
MPEPRRRTFDRGGAAEKDDADGEHGIHDPVWDQVALEPEEATVFCRGLNGLLRWRSVRYD